ncbi:MAG: cytochrome C [Campylobacterales bacterium]|nr:cytochrome C [Campylobacterales bacterium]
MKKIVLTLALVGSLSFASAYTKEDRINDMHDMAEAMNTIQSGFFYNNYDTVSTGVTSLSAAIAKVKPPMEEEDDKDAMAQYMNVKVTMTNKIVKNINEKALTILQRFKNGDSAQAVQAYTKIMGQCMKCHREIRHW